MTTTQAAGRSRVESWGHVQENVREEFKETRLILVRMTTQRWRGSEIKKKWCSLHQWCKDRETAAELAAPPSLFLVRLSLRVIMLGDSAKFSAWLCFEIRPIFLRRVVVIPQKSNGHSVVKVYNVRDLLTADLLQLADDYSLPLHQRNIQDWTDDVASVCRLPQQKKILYCG